MAERAILEPNMANQTYSILEQFAKSKSIGLRYAYYVKGEPTLSLDDNKQVEVEEDKYVRADLDELVGKGYLIFHGIEDNKSGTRIYNITRKALTLTGY